MVDAVVLDRPRKGERLSDLREHLFKASVSAHKAEQEYNRTLSKAGWWVGGIGAGIGVLGMTAAVACMIWLTPRVVYRTIDLGTGIISESFGAKDAPAHFNERVIRHYIAGYIENREQFVWQTDPSTDHLVKLMSAPAEQQRYADEKAKLNAGERYGLTGYARVKKFVWWKPIDTSSARDKTLEYDVQFIKTEVLASDPSRTVDTRETARIIFQFHPELPVPSDQDRLDNEAGLMVINYHADADN